MRKMKMETQYLKSIETEQNFIRRSTQKIIKQTKRKCNVLNKGRKLQIICLVWVSIQNT